MAEEFIIDEPKTRKERFYLTYDKARQRIKNLTTKTKEKVDAQDRGVDKATFTGFSSGGLGVMIPRPPPVIARFRSTRRGRYDSHGRVIDPRLRR